MKRVLTLFAALILIVTAHPLFAHGGPSYSFKRFIQFFDQNKDGQVTMEEFNKVSASRYKKIDKNGDGKITKDEFESYYKNSKVSRREKKFKLYDTNKDNKLSFEEYLDAKRKKLKKRFDRMDANKDGHITLQEVHAYKQKFRTDKRRSDRIFMILDRNKDGQVSEKESRKAWSLWFKRLDTNRDNKITSDDLN